MRRPFFKPRRDTLGRLYAKLGILDTPIFREPRRAFERRELCSIMNMNLATWLEEIQGYDPSQFDYEFLSQFSVKGFVCSEGGSTPPYTWSLEQDELPGWSPGVPHISGPNGYQFANAQLWAQGLSEYLLALQTIQSPFPTSGLQYDTNAIFLDLNNTGYIDADDANLWYTCVGMYGCN